MGACRIEFFDVPAFDVLEISNLRGGEGGMSYRKFYLSIYGNVELTGCKKVEPIVLKVSIYRYIEISNLRGGKGRISYRKFYLPIYRSIELARCKKVENKCRTESFDVLIYRNIDVAGRKRWNIVSNFSVHQYIYRICGAKNVKHRMDS